MIKVTFPVTFIFFIRSLFCHPVIYFFDLDFRARIVIDIAIAQYIRNGTIMKYAA